MRLLKLADIQHRIRTGDIALFRGRSIDSEVIELQTKSVYSHVGIFVWIDVCGLHTLWLIEAVRPRVRAIPFATYLSERCAGRGEAVDWFSVLPQHGIDTRSVATYAMSRVGNLYATDWQLARSFLLLTGWIADKLGMPLDLDPRREFCSELATAAFKVGGFEPDENDEPTRTSPGDLARWTCLHREGTVIP